MVSKALKLIFTFKMYFRSIEIGFLYCSGLIFGLVRPNLTIFIGVSWFLSYILETVGDRGLGMVLKVLKLNFMFEMGLWKHRN